MDTCIFDHTRFYPKDFLYTLITGFDGDTLFSPPPDRTSDELQ
jgi:hypothetical protein